ncbi:MAG: DNA/RNA nuclease SfsA [Zoogloeaceae bacterium]|nr:DNA/RNA nuclease SfsA [Zoogloeaceae bacterium]
MRLPPLTEGRLLRRYQRFLADVALADGSVVTAHCPNTGSMLGCKEAGSRVWLSAATRPTRKLPWTWELVEAAPGVKVGIHTGRTNALVREALGSGQIPSLRGYPRLRSEVALGPGTRIDFLLEGGDRPPCYLEVKNVTAAVDAGVALFPDAVTTRGARHLEVLQREVAKGARAALVFCAQRGDVREIRPADAIDPHYGRRLREALAAGVEVWGLGATIGLDEIKVDRLVPMVYPPIG